MKKDRNVENTSIHKLLYWISIIFSYAGVVNLGGMGVLPAIPFLINLYRSSLDKKSAPGRSPRRLLIFFLILYIFKHIQIPVFYPAIGKTFYLNKDVCFEQHMLERKSEVWISSLPEGAECHISEGENVFKVKKMIKGSKLIVTGTSVDTYWFTESYRLHAETSIGTLEYAPSRFSDDGIDGSLAKWADGSDVVESDLYRNIFYKPSQIIRLLIKPFSILFDLIVLK